MNHIIGCEYDFVVFSMVRSIPRQCMEYQINVLKERELTLDFSRVSRGVRGYRATCSTLYVIQFIYLLEAVMQVSATLPLSCS